MPDLAPDRQSDHHTPYLSVLGVNSHLVQSCQGGAGYNSWYGNGQVNALSAVSR